MQVFHVAWRNIWRNRRRTAITITAIALNAAVLIMTYGLMDGMMVHMISSVTNMVVGEAQIHAPEYLVNRSLYRTVPDAGRVLSKLREQNIPAAPRSYGYGLVALDTKSSGALFWGVDPITEKEVFDLHRHMGKGAFLKDRPEQGIVLGKRLARSLNARIGSEVVVVVQAADGSLGNELFRVTGILKSVGEAIDRNAAILHRSDFESLFVSEGRIHEIALNTRGALSLADLQTTASSTGSGLEVRTWRELLPSLSDMVNLFDASFWIFGTIFLLAAALGVMNTMLMATFERIREFGMLKALGATPWRILVDVSIEAGVLSAVSTALGSLLGVAGAFYLQANGLDMTVFASSDFSFAGIAFDPIWRASVSVKTVVLPVVTMWIICLAASLYPALLAARLDPVRAMVRV